MRETTQLLPVLAEDSNTCAQTHTEGRKELRKVGREEGDREKVKRGDGSGRGCWGRVGRKEALLIHQNWNDHELENTNK